MRRIAGKQLRIAFDRHGAKVPNVECRDRSRIETLRGCDHHPVNDSQPQGSIPSVKLLCSDQVVVAPPIDRERTVSEVAEEYFLRFDAEVRGNQVIDFRKNRRRQDPFIRSVVVQRFHRRVVVLVGVQQREHRAGIDDDHCSPSPASSSSAR